MLVMSQLYQSVVEWMHITTYDVLLNVLKPSTYMLNVQLKQVLLSKPLVVYRKA